MLVVCCSCSFKKSNSDKASKGSNPVVSQIIMSKDSDGDLITDTEEVTKGSDPFIAESPVFTGDFFNEYKLDLEFYNKATGGTDSLSWNVKDSKVTFPWDKTVYKIDKSSVYMESLLKSYAVNSGFSENNFRFFDYNDGVFSYSSPILTENALLSLSSRLLELERSHFQINRVSLNILARIKIQYQNFKYFKDPVFDIYYKDKDKQGLILIESRSLSGTYNFNEDNDIYIDFESLDSNIIQNAFTSGGASFFIKLRDFTIYETDTKYSSIIASITAKSVPVTIITTDSSNDSSNIVTKYIGTNAEPSLLTDILKKAFKENVLLTGNSIDQIDGLANRIRSFGDSRSNELLKWFVGANYINDDVFAYKFKPNEGIGLAYLSNKKVERTPISIVTGVINNNGPSFASNFLPIETNSFKILVTPKALLIPTDNSEMYIRSDCPRNSRGYEVDRVTYERIIHAWSDQITNFKTLSEDNLNLRIVSSKGIVLDGSINSILASGQITSSVLTNGDIEYLLSAKFISTLNKISGQKKIEINLQVPTVQLNIGATREVGRQCQLSPIDHGGGAQGTTHSWSGAPPGMKRQYADTGYGIDSESFKHQYDLNVRIINY